jgi:hypothetical protein
MSAARDHVVLLVEQRTIYGPMKAIEAAEFAAYLTAEVDPAVALQMQSPVLDLLARRRYRATPDETRTVNPVVERDGGRCVG